MSNPTFISNMKLKFPERFQNLCDPAFVYIVLAILLACLTCLIGSILKPSFMSLTGNTSGLSLQLLLILLCTFILSLICQTGETGVIISWVLAIPTIICIISQLMSLFSAGATVAATA